MRVLLFGDPLLKRSSPITQHDGNAAEWEHMGWKSWAIKQEDDWSEDIILSCRLEPTASMPQIGAS